MSRRFHSASVADVAEPVKSTGEARTSPISEPSNEVDCVTNPAVLVAALSGLDAGRDRALANRTRRAVHNVAADLQEGRDRGRRSTAIALLTLAGLLMLLSPAIWESIDEILGGEFLLDLPGMVAALAFTLFAAVAAVLFLVGGQGRRHAGQYRQ